MKKEDEIDKLFERLENQLDVFEPSVDHKARFLEKLQEQNKVVSLTSKKINWIKPLAIAASIAILIGTISIAPIFNTNEKADLASVSPQMEDTQNFFTVAIKNQLEEIDKNSSAETTELVADAMKQLEKLESSYEHLKKDLVESGNDKRVISAMIKNFQKRATLLEKVLEKIDNINKIKLNENETNIL
ncbi:hypothetical protein D1815_04610 [Aquimarina sp. AD1]|uniref:hypothetical protein n=1 Tax=Aquimarina sp. (strain AD1) TaxID=1714848 RepID=UPI000E4E30C9|nr:hypothetical protein [Aquimarina sp. AD1]AXT55071.1 hypothetical protein D1815_04610 [Aquimarina sp. AD1]RKN25528.1 hypothetical protein D7035_10055 [Aquimarina sp. AD1]